MSPPSPRRKVRAGVVLAALTGTLLGCGDGGGAPVMPDSGTSACDIECDAPAFCCLGYNFLPSYPVTYSAGGYLCAGLIECPRGETPGPTR